MTTGGALWDHLFPFSPLSFDPSFLTPVITTSIFNEGLLSPELVPNGPDWSVR